jgi:hypothetical protein
VLAGPALLLLLTASDIADAAPPRARAELDACAERIEEMKARRERGAELDRLLRRAQELAAELERAAVDAPIGAAVEATAPEELHERADAARDEADRLAAEIGDLDVRIQDARRGRGESLAGVERAVLGSPAPAPAGDRVRALLERRAALAERRARAEAEAARLDAEASAAGWLP